LDSRRLARATRGLGSGMSPAIPRCAAITVNDASDASRLFAVWRREIAGELSGSTKSPGAILDSRRLARATRGLGSGMSPAIPRRAAITVNEASDASRLFAVWRRVLRGRAVGVRQNCQQNF